MASLSDDQVRHAILEVLYKAAKENPETVGMERDKLQEVLKVPKDQIEFNTRYLEEKGLVVRNGFMGPPFWFASITALGIDVVERKDIFEDQFPFMKISIQQINAPVQGSVIQSVDSNVNFNQQVTDAFKRANEQVEKKTEILVEQKAEIKKTLKILEDELLNEEKDAGKMQKPWDWLKRNASWLVPTLTQVVLEGIKITFSGS